MWCVAQWDHGGAGEGFLFVAIRVDFVSRRSALVRLCPLRKMDPRDDSVGFARRLPERDGIVWVIDKWIVIHARGGLPLPCWWIHR